MSPGPELPFEIRSEGNYLDSDVLGDPDGAVHRNKAGKAGRPDLQARVDDFYAEIAPKLDAIDREFAEEHGFGFRPRIQGEGGGLKADLDQGGVGGGASAAGQQRAPARARKRSGKQAELFSGRGLSRGRGLTPQQLKLNI